MRNALLWGMCRSHGRQVLVQSSPVSRIAHLALAIFELIPVIGQLISLIELQIVWYRIHSFARLQPVSCIPQTETIVLQESPADIRRVWPVNLEPLGLTEAQKMEVDIHVRDAFRARREGHDIGLRRKKLIYVKDACSFTAVLPIALSILQKGESFQVLLFSKKIFSSGGERKIRWVYDLTAGNFLLKKRITGLFEERILTYLIPLRMARGIPTSVNWRNALDKVGEKKRQIIEPVRDGTLRTLLGTAPLSEFSVKRDLIIDLLSDLIDLHNGVLRDIEVTDNSSVFASSSQTFSYPLFHSDIKSLNILVFLQDGRWRAELCDFGVQAAHPVGFVVSSGFTPPEYIRFYNEKRPFGILKEWFDKSIENATFITQHGQGRDIWSMGLVILSLLVEREDEVLWHNTIEDSWKKTSVAPLPCLKKMLSGRLLTHYDEQGILDLKQETLNEEIDELQNEAALQHLKEQAELAKMFYMLKDMMLRIDPNERKTASECLAFLQQESEQIA